MARSRNHRGRPGPSRHGRSIFGGQGAELSEALQSLARSGNDLEEIDELLTVGLRFTDEIARIDGRVDALWRADSG